MIYKLFTYTNEYKTSFNFNFWSELYSWRPISDYTWRINYQPNIFTDTEIKDGLISISGTSQANWYKSTIDTNMILGKNFYSTTYRIFINREHPLFNIDIMLFIEEEHNMKTRDAVHSLAVDFFGNEINRIKNEEKL